MANKKKEYYKLEPMTEGKRNIIQGLLQEYNIESATDIQEALKDLLRGTIKETMESEDHFEVCKRNGHPADFRNARGHPEISPNHEALV